jgi:hypothetical protein
MDDTEIDRLLKANADSRDGLEATRTLFSMKTIFGQFLDMCGWSLVGMFAFE